MRADFVYVLATDHVPWQFDEGYEEACQGLGLKPTAEGYILYLLDSANGEITFVSPRVESATHDAARTVGDTALNGEFDPFHPVPMTLWPWWPYEFDGGFRCVFCQAPDGSFLFEGPCRRFAVPVYPRDGDPPPAGEARPGRMNWRACADCCKAIGGGQLRGLLRRFVEFEVEVPHEVRQVWAEFCADHGPARLDPAVPWTAARRARIADGMGRDWEQAKAICARAQPAPPATGATGPSGGVMETSRKAFHKAVDALYDGIAAGSLDRVRSWPGPGTARTVRVDGRGWNLVGRIDDGAIVLLAKYPDAFYRLQHADWVPPLLAELDRLGRGH